MTTEQLAELERLVAEAPRGPLTLTALLNHAPALIAAAKRAIPCSVPIKQGDGRVSVMHWDAEQVAYRIDSDRELYVIAGDKLRMLRSLKEMP